MFYALHVIFSITHFHYVNFFMKKFKILISRNFYKKQQNVMDLRKPSRIYYITFYLIAMSMVRLETWWIPSNCIYYMLLYLPSASSMSTTNAVWVWLFSRNLSTTSTKNCIGTVIFQIIFVLSPMNFFNEVTISSWIVAMLTFLDLP